MIPYLISVVMVKYIQEDGSKLVCYSLKKNNQLFYMCVQQYLILETLGILVPCRTTKNCMSFNIKKQVKNKVVY